MITFTTFVPAAETNCSTWGTAVSGETSSSYVELFGITGPVYSTYSTEVPAGFSTIIYVNSSYWTEAAPDNSSYTTTSAGTTQTTNVTSESGPFTMSASQIKSVVGTRTLRMDNWYYMSRQEGSYFTVYDTTFTFDTEFFTPTTTTTSYTLFSGSFYWDHHMDTNIYGGFESFTQVTAASVSQDRSGITISALCSFYRTGSSNGIDTAAPWYWTTTGTTQTTTITGISNVMDPATWFTTISTTSTLGASGNTTVFAVGGGNISESWQATYTTSYDTWTQYPVSVTTATVSYSVSSVANNSTGTTLTSTSSSSYNVSRTTKTWSGLGTYCSVFTVSLAQPYRILHTTTAGTVPWTQTIASGGGTTTQTTSINTTGTRWSVVFGTQDGLYITTTTQSIMSSAFRNSHNSMQVGNDVSYRIVLYESGVTTDTTRGNEQGWRFTIPTSNGILSNIASVDSTWPASMTRYQSYHMPADNYFTFSLANATSTDSGTITLHVVNTSTTTIHRMVTMSTVSTQTVTNYSAWPFPATTTSTYTVSLIGTSTQAAGFCYITTSATYWNSAVFLNIAGSWIINGGWSSYSYTNGSISPKAIIGTSTVGTTLVTVGGSTQPYIISGIGSATHLVPGPVLDCLTTTETTLTVYTTTGLWITSYSFSQEQTWFYAMFDSSTVLSTTDITTVPFTRTYTGWSSTSTTLNWTNSGVSTATTASYSTSKAGAASNSTTTSYTASFDPLPTTTFVTTSVGTDTSFTSVTTLFTCNPGTTTATITSSVSTTANTTTRTWSISTHTSSTFTVVNTQTTTTLRTWGASSFSTYSNSSATLYESWGNSFTGDQTVAGSITNKNFGRACLATVPLFGRRSPAAKQGFRYPWAMAQTDPLYLNADFTLPRMGYPVYSTTSVGTDTSYYIYTCVYPYTTTTLSGVTSIASNQQAVDWPVTTTTSTDTIWAEFPWSHQGRSVWVIPSFTSTFSNTVYILQTIITLSATATGLSTYTAAETNVWSFSSNTFSLTRSGGALSISTSASGTQPFTAYGTIPVTTSVSLTGQYTLSNTSTQSEIIGWGDLLVVDLFPLCAAGVLALTGGRSAVPNTMTSREILVGPFPVDVELYNIDSRWIDLTIDGVSYAFSNTGKRGQAFITLLAGRTLRLTGTYSVYSYELVDQPSVYIQDFPLEPGMMGGSRLRKSALKDNPIWLAGNAVGTGELSCRIGVRPLGVYPGLGATSAVVATIISTTTMVSPPGTMPTATQTTTTTATFHEQGMAGGYQYVSIGRETIHVEPLNRYEQIVNSQTTASTYNIWVPTTETKQIPTGEAWELNVITPYRVDLGYEEQGVSVKLFPTS